MADYLPLSDAEFDDWQSNLMTTIGSNLVQWGIPEADFDGLKLKQPVWESAWGKAANRQNRTQADVVDKDAAGTDYKKAIRSFVAQWLANNARVTDADRSRLGITVKTTTRTPVAVPATSPVASIDFSVRLHHTIHFADEAGGRSKAKPAGVHGCEIYVKTGSEPKDVSEMTYLGTDTATPFTVKYNPEQAGLIVYYRLRWVSTRGEAGPWSAIVSAVVPG
jgi:hypothetical protein